MRGASFVDHCNTWSASMADANELKFNFAAHSDYAPLTRHQELATEVVGMREGQLTVAKQDAYRQEMAFVQSKNDERRARWWSLAAYAVCSLAALVTALFTIQPGLQQRWRTICVVMVTVTIGLVMLGRKRDGRHAKHSWTQLRFKAPRS